MGLGVQQVKHDAIERALDLLDRGSVSEQPLSIPQADAILDGRVSIADLTMGGRVNVAALRLFAEISLAKLGVPIKSSNLRELLEQLRQEQRSALLAQVAQEPLEVWSPALVRRAEQILGREALLELARELYIEALRAGRSSSDAIRSRFKDLIDDAVVLRAKLEGIGVATTGRASPKKLAFLKARLADGSLDRERFESWAREQYLIAMYGKTVRARLAVSLAAYVDIDSITAEEIERGRAHDVLIDPTEIHPTDLELIDYALATGLISRDERDEALRTAMFHQFEQGAAGDPIAVAFELALGFVEWSQPALEQARRRGVELELRRLQDGEISGEQMEYLEASVVRGLLTREELDQARTTAYLELRFGMPRRPEAAERLRNYSGDAAWLARLPEKKPCWVQDVDLAAKLRSTLATQATAFAIVAEAIIEWLPLFAEPAQVRSSFEALLATLDDPRVSSPPIDRIRSVAPEAVRVALARAAAIIESVAPNRKPTGARVERRKPRRAQSGPRLSLRQRQPMTRT